MPLPVVSPVEKLHLSGHELNEMLTVIVGYSDILLHRRNGIDAFERAALEEIQRAAERSGLIARGMIEFK
ncbi:MAG: hypothetical protein U0791_05020 [Gemmataceae bacterium]